MTKRLMQSTLLVLLALSTTACPRRVEVESEPNPEYSTQQSMIIHGVYDWVVQGDDDTGTLTVTRSGAGYAATLGTRRA